MYSSTLGKDPEKEELVGIESVSFCNIWSDQTVFRDG
jgi:hypothetical protein